MDPAKTRLLNIANRYRIQTDYITENKNGRTKIFNICLTKGRLANQTLDMFEKIGITCEEMKDKRYQKN